MNPNWRTIKLGDVAVVQTGPFGSQLHESDYVKDGIPIITVENLIGGKIQFTSTTPLVARDDVQRLSKYTLKEGDVVFSRVGAVDRSAYCSAETDGWMFSGRILRVRPRSLLDSKYLNYYLSLETIKNRIRNHAVGGTMASLNTSILNSVPIVHPPLNVQRQIVAILGIWDKYLEKLEGKIQHKKQVKKGLMQQILSGKRRLSGFEKPWIQVQIGDLGNIVTGSTPPKDDVANYSGQYYWATAEDFNGKYISTTRVTLSEKGKRKSRFVKEGSILVTCIASIGKNAIVTRRMSMNQQINAIEVYEDFDNDFFYYLIGFSKNILLKSAGAGAMPMLSKSEFAKVKLFAPVEKTEQLAIAAILSTADSEIDVLEKQFQEVSKQRKYLVNNLVSGKIHAPELIGGVKEIQYA